MQARKPKTYLKSNMDRFIASLTAEVQSVSAHLKSNMDRFIGFCHIKHSFCLKNLKSNMDRFIVPSVIIER